MPQVLQPHNRQLGRPPDRILALAIATTLSYDQMMDSMSALRTAASIAAARSMVEPRSKINGSCYRLSGLKALVTGAAKGIGRAIVERFRREGASVVAMDLDVAPLAGLADDAVAVWQCDAADADALRLGREQVGSIDILVNCAGWVHQGTILDCSFEDWQRSFRINIDSAFATCQAFLPAMIEQRRGNIINIASIASSIKAAPNRAAYASTKAAMIGLTKSVAIDFVTHGIRCNAICPGMVASPSLEDRINSFQDPAAALATFITRQPIGRLGNPQEIAAAAAYLASDESALMTGSTLILDGGAVM